MGPKIRGGHRHDTPSQRPNAAPRLHRGRNGSNDRPIHVQNRPSRAYSAFDHAATGTKSHQCLRSERSQMVGRSRRQRTENCAEVSNRAVRTRQTIPKSGGRTGIRTGCKSTCRSIDGFVRLLGCKPTARSFGRTGWARTACRTNRSKRINATRPGRAAPPFEYRSMDFCLPIHLRPLRAQAETGQGAPNHSCGSICRSFHRSANADYRIELYAQDRKCWRIPTGI